MTSLETTRFQRVCYTCPVSDMQKKRRILVVSHDEAIRVFVTEILRANGQYETITVENGTLAMQRAIRQAPDLVIVDMMMPHIDGYHICRMLRAGTGRHIPLIMLSYQGVSLGAETSRIDDILPTPFDPMALLARVDAVLRRHPPHYALNPFIQLAGHIQIARELRKFSQFAVGYADLDNLAAVNALYGSTRGDQIIGQTKRIIHQALHVCGTPHDFVKHVSGDDFVFVTTPERIEAVCRNIIEQFDGEIPTYLACSPPPADTEAERASRTSYQRHSPVSISIAVVTNVSREFTDFVEIGEVAVELRKYLKTLPGSNYYINRRNRR